MPRNPQAFSVFFRIIAVWSVVAALAAGWIVGKFVHFSIGAYGGSRFLTFLIIITIAGAATLIRYIKWQSVHYLLSPEGIVVTDSVGMLGKKQKIYLYESIITASVNQNFFGRKYGYGDIHLTIPKLEKKLMLKDLDQPASALTDLQARIHKRVGINSVLVT